MQLRVDNATDEFGYSSVVTNLLSPSIPAPTFGTGIRPRSFTIALTARF